MKNYNSYCDQLNSINMKSDRARTTHVHKWRLFTNQPTIWPSEHPPGKIKERGERTIEREERKLVGKQKMHVPREIVCVCSPPTEFRIQEKKKKIFLDQWASVWDRALLCLHRPPCYWNLTRNMYYLSSFHGLHMFCSHSHWSTGLFLNLHADTLSTRVLYI